MRTASRRRGSPSAPTGGRVDDDPDVCTRGVRGRRAMVLLSDGDTTQGRPNDEAASEARDRGIPVHTIAFGTDAGYINDPLDPFSQQ